MQSPFPGMDPYLERHWLDVHTKLVTYAADELNRVLPQTLVARAEERVAVTSAWDIERLIGPDVRVFERNQPANDPANGGGSGAGTLLEDAPYRLELAVDPIIERFIHILDESGRLVTVVEFLSPTNKRGDGIDAYRDKRADLLEGGVNLVEVDLVRQGDWRAMLRPHVCPSEAVAEYRITVRTPPGRLAFLYPAPLRAQLPDVTVPLPRDAKVRLPLQDLVNQVYANGRYGLTVDYRRPCDPPLSRDDEIWADQLLRASGKR